MGAVKVLISQCKVEQIHTGPLELGDASAHYTTNGIASTSGPLVICFWKFIYTEKRALQELLLD